jgi:SRSO17 transposase
LPRRRCRTGAAPRLQDYVIGVRSDHHFGSWGGQPPVAGIQTLVAVEGHRRAIEDSFETARNTLGLDHNETRSWHGWHRHVTLVMLAFAMMAVIRYRANDIAPPKKPRMRTTRI